VPEILFHIFRLLRIRYIIDRLKHGGLRIPQPPITFEYPHISLHLALLRFWLREYKQPVKSVNDVGRIPSVTETQCP